MAITVSLINMKGGVGKTTIAAQLAHAAARRGVRTLAVDLDPQSNLSQALLSPEKYRKHILDKKPTVVQIFDQYFPTTESSGSPRPLDIEQVVLNVKKIGSKPMLDLIVSRLELSRALKKGVVREQRLAKALARVADDYGLILIDCAPTESILTEAAYHASRYALVPVKPEYLATIGLPLLAGSIQEFKYDNGDHALDICGIVFNHSSSYSDGPEESRSVREVQSEAKRNGWPIFETHVRYSRSYAKAAREGTAIGSTSNVRWWVSRDFSRFVEEFFRAIGFTQEVE